MIGDNLEAAEVDGLIQKLWQSAFKRGGGSPPTLPPPEVLARSVDSADGEPLPLEIYALPEDSLYDLARRPGVVWMYVVLSVALGLAVPFWPYPKACAWWLLLYLMTVATEIAVGVWGARLTWETRLGIAHSVALGTVFWGALLAAHEILPRIGYPTAPATWLCP